MSRATRDAKFIEAGIRDWGFATAMTTRSTPIAIHTLRSPLPGSRVQRSPSNPALGVLPRAFGRARRLTPSPQSPVPQAGFTLLEILLALVLLAFVMAGVWGALAGATRITHSTDAVMAQGEQVRTVQQFLRRYVSAAAPEPYTTRPGAAPRMFMGDASSMQYVAPLPMQSGHAGLYLQTLSLHTDGAGNVSLELAYQPYTNDAPATQTPVTRRLLAGLHGGKFQYLGTTAFGQPPSWRDAWRSNSGMPLAVRIDLDPAWRARVPFPVMVIPLRAGEGFDAQGATVP